MNKYERTISVIMLCIISLSNVATTVAYAAPLGKFHFAFPNQASVDPNTFTKPPDFALGDHGSVLGASTSLFTIGTQKLDIEQPGNTGSAIKRIPISVQTLEKKVYETTEDVALTVLNPDNDPFTTAVTDANNNSISVPVTESTNGLATTVDLAPSNQLKPGLYKVTITDTAHHSTEQDFTWGVLALNTDKSMYHAGEKADISMAVLNNNGDMVCDAALKLDIQDKNGNGAELATNGAGDDVITVNPQCQKHDYSLQPDYEGHYTFGAAGTYTMTLAATTTGGTHTITDTIQVTDKIPFDVQRVSATRIYPPNAYPMLFNITANRDFNGTVTETVPDSFTITPATQSAAQSYTGMQTVYLNSNDPAAAMSQQIASGSGGLVMPFHGSYPITQGFGAQLTDPSLQAFYTHYGLGGHDGIDFGVPMNTPLYTVDDGTVIWAGPGDYGTMVTVLHSWGQTYYGHMTNVSVSVGEHVTKGQLIGYSGMSGEATGPHLHFGMKPKNPDMSNGYYGKIDPMPFLPVGQGESISVLGPATNPVAQAVYNTTVLGASDSATTPTPTDTPSPTPTVTSDPVATASATTPTPTDVSPTPSATPTPTPTPASSGLTVPADTNSNFTVLDKDIKINEQIANSALTDKVKVITWRVNMKKGESTTLGYDYLAPRVSPQFYLLGPAKFYSGGDDRVVFQEDRQWQIASDDVGVDWYTNTTGHQWNGYSWQYRKKLVIDHTKVQTTTASPVTPTIDFMDDGGDANAQVLKANGGFWDAAINTTVVDSAISHTGSDSIKCTSTSGSASMAETNSASAILADAGRRISSYFYFDNLPTGNLDIIRDVTTGGLTNVFTVRITSTGVLQLANGSGTQIGTNGPTLSQGTWYRISVAYVVTSTTNYSINVYVNGVLATSHSQTSGGTALANTGSVRLYLGWGTASVGTTLSVHIDDIYVDSGTDLTDPGDVRITNKRPFSNGTTNNFTASGTPSGFGSGNAPYVNEIPPTNAQVAVTTAAKKTEEYNIESLSSGDADLTGKTLLGHQGWIYAKNATPTGSTSHIIVDGTATVISVTSITTIFTKVVTSSSYSAGTGTDIGMDGAYSSSNTYTFYNAGVQFAYIGDNTAPTFIESGTDATHTTGMYQDNITGDSFVTGTGASYASDCTSSETGSCSVKLSAGTGSPGVGLATPFNSAPTGGLRMSMYVNFATSLPASTVNFVALYTNVNTFQGEIIELNSAHKLMCADGVTVGTTALSSGTWYRISLGISESADSTTYNYKMYLNGTLEVTCSSQTLAGGNAATGFIVAGASIASQIINFDDLYMDSTTDQSDTGDYHVTAKMPFSNGSSNGYSTTGSPTGYPTGATGNAQYTGERPLNNTAYVSTSSTSSSENYTLEGSSSGDVDISSKYVIATQAWVDAKVSATNCTGQITTNGTNYSIFLTTTETIFTQPLSTNTYPSGSSGIGIKSCSTANTTTFYEGGMVIAYSSTDPNGLANFPVLVSLSGDNDIKAHAQANCGDVVFTDSTGKTALNFDIDDTTSGNDCSGSGNMQAWVQIPSLSGTTDTVIYMYYGNPSATITHNSSTWDSNYKGVWHMGAGTGTATNDSTSNANNGTITGASFSTGEIGDDLNFNGQTNIVNAGSGSSIDNLSSGFTIEAWINPTNTDAFARPFVAKADGSGLGSGWDVYYEGDLGMLGFSTSCSGNDGDTEANSVISINTWQQVVIGWSGGLSPSTSLKMYVNGTEESHDFDQDCTAGGGSGYNADASDNLTIGQWTGTPASGNFLGGIDEVRVSNTVRSANWIKTEYNTESSPSTFIPTASRGSEETDIYAPTLSQMMRHGEFFNTQGQVQPFAF